MSTSVADQVIKAFRPLHAGETGCNDAFFKVRLQRFIDRGQAIPFVIPAFPGKSINKNSVAGPLPDLGEELALQNLRGLIDAVGNAYAPGMNLHIVSDGHFFIGAGIVRPPAELDAYVDALRDMKKSDRIILHTIHDFYPKGDMAQKLATFEKEYMPGAVAIREHTLSDPYYARTYSDLMAFVHHEFIPALYPTAAKPQKREFTKMIARQFVGLRMAVAHLIEDRFQDHLRLSIHQQDDPMSEKYYINLLPNVEGKGSPWFHTLTQEGDGRMKMRKRVESSPPARSRKNGNLP